MANENGRAKIDKNELHEKITSQDVAVVAKKAFNDSSIRVVNYRIDDYSKDKLGFAGFHQSLKIIVERKDTDDYEETSFFVKSIPDDCEELANYIRQQGIFDGESSFYEKLVPELTKNYKGERWSSNCFLVKKDVMVLEDLRSQGYRTIGHFFDQPILLKAALTTLAQFHGCSILAEARLNQTSQPYTTLQNCYPDCFYEKIFDRSKKRSTAWFKTGVEAIVAIAERLGCSDSKKLRRAFEQLYELVKPSTRHHNVATHCDLWTNNLMFDDSQPIPRCILVDFQHVRYAPMVLDILMLLYFSTSRKYRRSKERDLIAFYYSVLEKTVIAGGILPKKAKCPTLEDIMAEYEDLRIFGPALACLYLPVVLLNPKDANRYTKDSESYHEFFYVNRTGITLDHMEKDPFYKERVEEVVAEFIGIAKHARI